MCLSACWMTVWRSVSLLSGVPLSVYLFSYPSDCLRACLPVRSACLPCMFASLPVSCLPPSCLFACFSVQLSLHLPLALVLVSNYFYLSIVGLNCLCSPYANRMQNTFTLHPVSKNKHDLLTKQRSDTQTPGKMEYPDRRLTRRCN